MSKRKTIIAEDALVVLLQSKDQRGFSILYDNYSSALYGVILKIVRSEEIAADVMQDSFVKIWKNIDAYNRSKGTLFTWILNVARNTAIDRIRSQEFQNSQRNQDIDSNINLIDNQESSQFDVDAIGLKKVVEHLRPEHQQMIELLYFKGYTQAEVADEFGIPLGTVKTRVKAAIVQLRQYFVQFGLVLLSAILDKWI
ncbi:sigma-70 family RNA polymerase sigma factor [Arcicella sp. LKC2W]|jgi:RNA polymerase sigma-70 factor, ECF subfamily|uniref:RNA polymerase sigma factor n=1 Tax=Arcicella sp. LKC2W TaxID=2984198 RepID=UPI002B220E28|nr:sigma-70 family RNA polymerase sigma factor [Arcicella sp. LKC2W]MEA5458082.1 sigma-70 family RNA polymerase sigma factor [Arcicella sp. LKC2W]